MGRREEREGNGGEKGEEERRGERGRQVCS